MNKDQIIKEFIVEIRANFPDVGDCIDKRMKALGYGAENYMFTDMMECFSQVTTDAIKAKDSETVSKHLNYMSKKLDNASEVEREYINVYYTEPLMWDIKDREIKSWAGSCFPQTSKSYI